MKLLAALLALGANAINNDSPISPVEVQVSLSSPSSPFLHTWKESFGSGHALLATRADWRAHLESAITDIGIKRLRFHGILDDDMSVTTDGTSYNFYNVDNVYDYILSVGVEPFVELSFMPSALVSNCSTEDRSGCSFAFGNTAGPGSYKGLIMEPADYEKWHDLVKAFASHLVSRHGLSTVNKWPFEVWNELWGIEYHTGDLNSPYLKLYNASATALKSISTTLQVGGPATQQLQHLDDFLADTRTLNIPVDFVSSHFYPSDPECVAVRAPSEASAERSKA